MTRQSILWATAWAAGLGLSAAAQPVKLSLQRQPNHVRLSLQGVTGKDYVVESSTDLAAASASGWQHLLTLTLAEGFAGWLDAAPASARAPRRFYRAIQLDAASPRPQASDFRLLDHQGRSHSLFYHSDARAVVLVFADNTALREPELVALLRALRGQFASRGVLGWLINAHPAEDRSSIAAEASAQGIDFPILKDDGQVVAREFGATAQPEAIAIDPTDWTIFFRGAINDRLAPPGGAEGVEPTSLASALENFLAGQPIVVKSVRPDGAPLPLAPLEAVSYARDIAPLLQRYCVSCHSPGQIAPWSMTSFEEVKDHALEIKNEVLLQHMPPWHADPHYGRFANDMSLPPDLRAKLIQWIDAGAPRGEGPDPLAEHPPPPPSDWPLGPPDYILSIEPQTLPASGVIDYRYLFLPSPVPDHAWLRAAVVRPGNRKVVHHCLVFAGTTLAELIDLQGGLRGYFASYVPGAEQRPYPDGTGKLLKKGTTFIFQMHYTTSGKPETDRTQLGLYLAPSPPALELKTSSAYTTSIDIPPGAKEYTCQAEFTFARSAWLYELSPHMHYRGAWFNFQAVYPDGTREMLLSVPKYEFDWQTLYRLAEPKRLPAGTRIVCRGAFDNSAQNPHNPDPGARVRFGLQSWDEMFIGYFNFADAP